MNQIFFMCLVSTTTHIMTDSKPACKMTLLEFEHRLYLKVFDTLFNTDYTHIKNFKQKNKNCDVYKLFIECANLERNNPLPKIELFNPTIQEQTTVYANYLNAYQSNSELQSNINWIFIYLNQTDPEKIIINKLCPIPSYLTQLKEFKPVFDYITE